MSRRTGAGVARRSSASWAVGCLSAANHPHFEGFEDYRGEVLHTGEWPHEPVDFAGKRVAVIGTGLLGDPVDPGHGSGGGGAHRLPAHAQLRRAGLERAARPRAGAGRSRPTIRPSAPGPARARPASTSPTTPARRSTRRRRSAAASMRSAGSAAGCPSSARSATCCSTRKPTTPRRTSRREKIRERVDGPPDGRTALPGQCVRLQAALRRYRLLRDLQSGPCDAGRYLDRARSSASPPAASWRTASNTRRTRSSSPPASRR